VDEVSISLAVLAAILGSPIVWEYYYALLLVPLAIVRPRFSGLRLEVAIVPTATVNGISLYYELHGDSGEPLVLVHGYTGDVTDWRHQIPELSRTHRVLMMDLRGHGRSEAPKDRSSYTVDQMASDVEALIDQVGFERYHLLGHSMGGGIVQEIALRSPQRLLSLTLHDTSFKFALMADPAVEEWWKGRMALAEAGKMADLAAMPPLGQLGVRE